VQVIYSIDAQRQSLGKLGVNSATGSADGPAGGEPPSLPMMFYFKNAPKSRANDLQGVLGAFFSYGIKQTRFVRVR